MVILGAASRRLILKEENLLEYIKALFRARGEKIVEMNLKAFCLGREAANSQNL
jgi:Pyruvate/2-oxoacid:ferredoxin oxidoreductase gamma subunit